MKKVLSIIAIVGGSMLMLSAPALAAKNNPHLEEQDGCDHGNSGKACKPDPQPDHGKECEKHGKHGGINEDHCLAPTTTTTAPPVTTTTQPPVTTTTTVTTPGGTTVTTATPGDEGDIGTFAPGADGVHGGPAPGQEEGLPKTGAGSLALALFASGLTTTGLGIRGLFRREV